MASILSQTCTEMNIIRTQGEKVVKDEKILQSNTSLDVPFKRHVTNFIKKENGNSAPFISSIVSQKSYQDGKLLDDESLLLVKKTAEKNSNAFELADLPEGKEHGLQPMVGIAIPLKLKQIYG